MALVIQLAAHEELRINEYTFTFDRRTRMGVEGPPARIVFPDGYVDDRAANLRIQLDQWNAITPDERKRLLDAGHWLDTDDLVKLEYEPGEF